MKIIETSAKLANIKSSEDKPKQGTIKTSYAIGDRIAEGEIKYHAVEIPYDIPNIEESIFKVETLEREATLEEVYGNITKAFKSKSYENSKNLADFCKKLETDVINISKELEKVLYDIERNLKPGINYINNARRDTDMPEATLEDEGMFDYILESYAGSGKDQLIRKVKILKRLVKSKSFIQKKLSSTQSNLNAKKKGLERSLAKYQVEPKYIPTKTFGVKFLSLGNPEDQQLQSKPKASQERKMKDMQKWYEEKLMNDSGKRSSKEIIKRTRYISKERPNQRMLDGINKPRYGNTKQTLAQVKVGLEFSTAGNKASVEHIKMRYRVTKLKDSEKNLFSKAKKAKKRYSREYIRHLAAMKKKSQNTKNISSKN